MHIHPYMSMHSEINIYTHLHMYMNTQQTYVHVEGVCTYPSVEYT